MTRLSKPSVAILCAAVMTVAALVIIEVGLRTTAEQTLASNCVGDTMCDQATAMAWSLAMFPTETFSVTHTVARLVTMGDALAWQHAIITDPADPSLSKPMWVVGIRAAGMTVADPGHPGADPLPLDGVWYVWNATNSGLDSTGGLGSPDYAGGSTPTYASIEALVSKPLQIDPATPFPTITPGPSPTSDVPLLPGQE